MIALATDDGVVLVANHHRFAPAEDILDVLERGQRTADDVADALDLSTRDVVASLNMLAAGTNPLVRRCVPGVADRAAHDGWRTLAARWELLA